VTEHRRVVVEVTPEDILKWVEQEQKLMFMDPNGLDEKAYFELMHDHVWEHDQYVDSGVAMETLEFSVGWVSMVALVTFVAMVAMRVNARTFAFGSSSSSDLYYLCHALSFVFMMHCACGFRLNLD
jgi:hypothetical protein